MLFCLRKRSRMAEKDSKRKVPSPENPVPLVEPGVGTRPDTPRPKWDDFLIKPKKDAETKKAEAAT